MKVALLLKKLGLNSTLMHSLGVDSIGGAVSRWGRSAAKSDKHAQARAERLAISLGFGRQHSFCSARSYRTSRATPDEQVEQARMKIAA